MASLVERREELIERSNFIQRLYQEAGPDLDMSKITSLEGDSNWKVGEIQRLNKEVNEIGAEVDRLSVIEQIGVNNALKHKQLTEVSGAPFPFPQGGSGAPRSQHSGVQESLKKYIGEHKGYRAFRDGGQREVSMQMPVADFKTLITLTTVNAQADRREPVDMALEDRTIADLCLQGNVDGNTVEYYEETTFTNAAANVAEGDAKAESALAWTLRTESVRKIAHWIPATTEALSDVSFLESQIRGRLAFGVRRREEAQIYGGDGNAPNLRGIINRSGIQTQAKGADPTPDAIYRAMQKVRGASGAGFAEPTAVVLHPNDWTDIKLLRTADGIYIWGNPSDEGPDRIWGKMVRQTTAATEGTGLVGAFRPYAEVLRREGITITLSTEHASYFIENKVAILAESRLALAVYRPSAFATVTGI
jgi:HK97 family phage major capsid protein